MSIWKDWDDRARAEHAAQVAAGRHDAGCEWRAAGHFLCNCSKRRREASGFTTPPGPLEFSPPECPKCGEFTTHDGDCFCCYVCHVAWPDPHQPGEFTDDHGVLDTSRWDDPGAADAGP